MDMRLSKLQETVKDREACSPQSHKKSDVTEQLNNKEKDKYAQYHLPCGLKKKQTQRNREEKSSYQGGRNRERLVKGYKLSIAR